jgi:DNA-binding transcriptional regulator YiaG
MSPAELTKIRKRMQLSQPALATALAVEKSTVWRWETGAVQIPKVAELAVRYLLLTRRERKNE